MKKFWILAIFIVLTVAEEDNPCIGNEGVRRFPDPTDCTRFFLCIGEESFPSQCGVNLIFDVVTEHCNEEHVSVCIKDIETPPTPSVPGDTTVTPPGEETTGVPEAPTPGGPTTNVPEAPTPTPAPVTTPAPGPVTTPTLAPPVTTPTPAPVTTPPPGPTPHCPPDQVFYAPHPDCTRFFRCVFGTLHVLDCPPNQHWNQEREFCDHPFNVQCPSSA